MPNVVQDGAVVSLSYTLKLANGEVVDFTEADDPLEYLHGADNIIPGLEKEMTGLSVGDTKQVEVSAEEGYGEYDPEDVEVIERGKLPKNLPPLQLGMVLAIGDEDGNFSEAFVREISASKITLDFNHPLAGQKLFFDVKVIDIRDATQEEIEHGHPHGVHGHDDFEDFDDYEFDEDDFEDDEDDDYEQFLDDDDDQNVSRKN
jgi:FKBP-type peptidyl-prolyl cis-trans isomerase SlyD